MSYNINLIERLVLESLQNKPKTALEIHICTSLETKIIQGVLESLISKNIVTIGELKYLINKNISDEIRKELNNPMDIKIELAEILNSTFNLREESSVLKLKKVHMNEKEEKLFHGLLYNMESFLTGLEKKQENLSKQKVFFWGGGNYGKIINNYLNF